MTPSSIKKLAENAIVALRIEKKWDPLSVSEYRVTEGDSGKFTFIPKNKENNEKYGTWLYHSNVNGVWMGKYTTIGRIVKLYQPVPVIQPDAVKELAKAEKMLNITKEMIPSN